jgi:hypothetical protein
VPVPFEPVNQETIAFVPVTPFAVSVVVAEPQTGLEAAVTEVIPTAELTVTCAVLM